MATEIHVRKLAKSWQYDFKRSGHPTERRGGFRTKQAALTEAAKRLIKLESAVCEISLDEAFQSQMVATKMKDQLQ